MHVFVLQQFKLFNRKKNIFVKQKIYSVSIYKGMIIATTVTITMTTKESDDKSQIRIMGTNKFIPKFK